MKKETEYFVSLLEVGVRLASEEAVGIGLSKIMI